jgi:hypothetical protein
VGLEGLWWAYTTAAVASFLIGVAWFRRGTWTEGVIDDETEEPAAEPTDD